MTTFKAASDWVAIDDEEFHFFRFVKAKGEIIGGVLKHAVLGTGTDDVPVVWCEPGLVQWVPYGPTRTLFSVAGGPGQKLSLTPFVVCEICGDKGWITESRWVPKYDYEGVGTQPPITILEEDDEGYSPAIRRDLGDTVPGEEEGADRRLYDMSGGPTQITSEFRESEYPDRLDDDMDDEEREALEMTLEEALARRDRAIPVLGDSGHRTEFPSGALRDRPSGKGRYDQLQWMGLHRVALILEAANVKYGDARNYEKGMPIHEFIDSAVRHIAQYVNGETDEDHLAQATWNLLSALQTEEMIARGLLPGDLFDMPNYEGLDLDERLPRKDG